MSSPVLMVLVIGVAYLVALGTITVLQKAPDRWIDIAATKLSCGDSAGARAILEKLKSVHALRGAAVARLDATCRLRDGDVTGALASLDGLLDHPVWSRLQLREDWVGAHALRAMIRAAHGDDVGANSDIGRVRRFSRAASSNGLAHTALAEALLVVRKDDIVALQQVLDEHHDVLFQGATGADLAAARAFRRLSLPQSVTPYRAAAADVASSWLPKLVPRLAPVMSGPFAATAPRVDLPEATEAARQAVRSARVPPVEPTPVRSTSALVRGAWVGAVGAFMVTWSLLAPGRAWGVGTNPWSAAAVAMVLLAIVVGLMWVTKSGPIGRAHLLRQGLQLARTGRLVEARAAFEQCTDAPELLTAARASSALATLDYDKGELEGALRHADRALARFTAVVSKQPLMADALNPMGSEVGRVRAVTLAALERHDEAVAELEQLDEHAGLAAPRVAVIRAAHEGRYRDAEAHARYCAAMGDIRDAVVFDMLRAAQNGLDAAALEQLADDMHDARRAAWAVSVLPELHAAAMKAVAADSVAVR